MPCESLTPVRVRGKRKAASSTSSTSTTATKRPRGRPLIKLQTPTSSVPSTRSNTPASETSMASNVQKRGTSAPLSLTEPTKKTRRRRKLAPLEQMPAEILQEILWRSLNPEMPLASPVLASKLDSEHVRMEFCMRAIYRTGRLKMVPVTKERRQYLEEQERRRAVLDDQYTMQIVERPEAQERQRMELQSQLLRRRFFTTDFLQKYVDKAEATWDAEHPAPCKVEYYHAYCDRGIRLLEYLEIYGFARGAYMPEKFLKGPVEKSKIKKWIWSYLALILKLDTEHSPTSEETLMEALREAILRNDREMLESMMRLAVENGILPTTDMLRIAVMEVSNPDPRLIREILESSKYHQPDDQRTFYSIDRMDPQIWAWIEQRGESVKWFRDMYFSYPD
ncbi:hypothetical protein K490DRAFT_69543 [Saccharata proteae CBS 121410]|uniref:Uncharacterized protein n=1 Tax=Saccharata proteae CBS 121410 TaxID=1314787 RepID=A0A9P4LW64_9PEZI|nr:hypothetical protein K490DRAFT_69543 [Saccharata proteae CBS 121410]